MNKPFIMTHIAIFVLSLCTMINVSRLLEHLCCEGGTYYFDIMWYLGFIMFFSFMMIIFGGIACIYDLKSFINFLKSSKPETE